MRCSSVGLLAAFLCAAPAAAQTAADDGHPTLAEARVSPRCDGTQWASKIAKLRAADPERDADQSIAAGDHSIIGVFRTLPTDGTGPHTSIQHIYSIRRQSGRRIEMITYAFGYGDIACKIVAPAWRSMSDPATQDGVGSWCAEALDVLTADYGERFNARLVVHPRYNFKDICTPGAARQGSESDQPLPDQVPEQIPDMVTAARFGLVEHAKRFIAESADLTGNDIFGYDALQWSVTRSYPGLFDALIASAATYDFCASLRAAVKHGRGEMMLPLTTRCPEAQVRIQLVRQVAEQENIASLRVLLDTEPALRLAGHAEGGGALKLAVNKSNVELARFLLDRGADPNIRHRAGGGAQRSLLRRAIELRNAAMVELLLDNGADAAAQGTLHYAVEQDARDIIEVLASRGADLNAAGLIRVAEARMLTDPLGREGVTRVAYADPRVTHFAEPPVFLAIDPLMNSAMVGLLLRLGANPDVYDGEGRSPLMVAISNSQIFGKRGGAPWIERYVPQRLIPGQEDWEHRGLDAVRMLLDAGAGLGLTDRNGLTALHHAARSDYNVAIARMLLDRGADPNVKDAAGKTPLDHARAAKLERMPAVLIAAGGRAGLN